MSSKNIFQSILLHNLSFITHEVHDPVHSPISNLSFWNSFIFFHLIKRALCDICQVWTKGQENSLEGVDGIVCCGRGWDQWIITSLGFYDCLTCDSLLHKHCPSWQLIFKAINAHFKQFGGHHQQFSKNVVKGSFISVVLKAEKEPLYVGLNFKMITIFTEHNCINSLYLFIDILGAGAKSSTMKERCI